MTPAAVVVTGIGCLGPFGLGLDALRAALALGEPLHSDIDRSAGYHRPGSATKVAACHGLDLSPWLSDEAARRMSDLSQFAVTAARMALADARLDVIPAERTAVAIATAFGPGGFTEQLALQVLQKGGKFASPFLFTDCVANAAAGQIAIALQARGPNTTICQREAGPLLALGQGAEDVALGRADVALCGAVDELKPLSHAILDRFRARARPGPDG
jgi:3-oxoacyl-[acyl-carrier-protein] synthase II